MIVAYTCLHKSTLLEDKPLAAKKKKVDVNSKQTRLKTKLRRDQSSVAAKNRQIRQEAIREQIQAKKIVEEIFKILTELKSKYRTLKPTQVQALRVRLQSLHKLLDKLVPNEQAIELRDPDGNNPVAGLAEAIRAAMGDEAE